MNSIEAYIKFGKAVPRPPLVSMRSLDQLRERICYKRYSIRTEETYVQWVRRFVRYNGLRYPRDLRQLVFGNLLRGTGMRSMLKTGERGVAGALDRPG